MQAFMLHPLCFRVDRIMQKVFCPVDYGFITEICPNGRFCVIGDSDDCLIMELQAGDVESHLLRIAPKRKSLRQRLSRLRREIAAVAAAWTTTEHLRSAKHTIYYHENDLPSDLAQRVAPSKLWWTRSSPACRRQFRMLRISIGSPRCGPIGTT